MDSSRCGPGEYTDYFVGRCRITMKTPVNAGTLRHHFMYSWWKYLLAILAGTLLVNLIFTVTEPRTPEDKKVDFYIYGYADSFTLDEYMEKVRFNEMPDMESMTSLNILTDSTYGPMQLTTYIAVQEGDLYLLPRDEFLSLSAAGSFAPLENDAELMAIFDEAGKSLRRGWRTLSDSDETHLYGIPADTLPSLSTMAVAPDGYLAVLVRGGNTDNTMKFLRILCKDMIVEPEPAPESEPQASEPAPSPNP